VLILDPSENKFLAMRESGRFNKQYLDRYNLQKDIVNPLIQLVPALQLDDNGECPPFFGPYVLNIVCVTGEYLTDIGGWDGESYELARDLFKKAYPSFACYETHVMMDGDSFGVQDGDFLDLLFTEDLMTVMCNELADYGFTWHGRLSTIELDEKIEQIVNDFNERLKLL
jgi:hypothetical protein